MLYTHNYLKQKFYKRFALTKYETLIFSSLFHFENAAHKLPGDDLQFGNCPEVYTSSGTMGL